MMEVINELKFVHDRNEQRVLYSNGKSYLVKEFVDGNDSTTVDDSFKVNVVFDGDIRSAATFRIDVAGSASQSGRGITNVQLSSASTAEENKWAALHLMGPSKNPEVSENLPQ
ncbi:MAG: hypothetical protein RIR98_57, partial [Bacteroidota bacterium]